MLGRVSDAQLDGLYRGARALVMPSLLEGYGLPVREALARGTPAVLSDLPVFGPELDSAVLRVAPGDEAALTAALLALERENGLRARLAAAAPAAVAGSELGRSGPPDAGGPGAGGAGGAMISVVIPNWNGRRWLASCLAALSAQERRADEVIVVDNGSRDGSLEYLRDEHPAVRVISLSDNTGFAHAANVGLDAAGGELVALVNTDVELAPDWLARTAAVLEARPDAAAVACKMLSRRDPGTVDDAGDVLRRDGVCEQRGRFGPDDGRWDAPGEVFGACAGAALYRRAAVLGAGGFYEAYFAYLEDVDLALRLRLAGWSCRYEPAVALHAAQGSSDALPGGAAFLATRNTLVLVARFWPLRWLGLVAYRQLGWAWHAARERRLRAHLRALGAAVPMLPAALRERRRLRLGAEIPIGDAIPSRPWRGAGAQGNVNDGHRGRP